MDSVVDLSSSEESMEVVEGGARISVFEIGKTATQFSVPISFEDFLKQIREDVQNVDRKELISKLDELALNQYDYSPEGEKILDMYKNGDTSDPRIIALAEMYCPGITQHSVLDRKYNVITQLFPKLLQTQFKDTVRFSDLKHTTHLFNVFYNIDRVSKKFQISRSIPNQLGLQQKFIGLFKDIPSAPAWPTKLVHGEGKPHVALYYDDDHILVSGREIDTELDLKKTDAPDIRLQFTQLRYFFQCPRQKIHLGELPAELDVKKYIKNTDLYGLSQKDLKEVAERENTDQRVYKALAVLKFKNDM